MTQTDMLFTKRQWQPIGERHHHGICVPLFSLKAYQGSAIGEFLDLIPLICWCESIGFDVIQLLPLNDSGKDPSPYSAHTAMGLHPIYLSLHALPYLGQFPELLVQSKAFQTSYDQKQVPYHKVLESKLSFLKKYFEKVRSLVLQNHEYISFKRQKWVLEYAEYKSLKELNNEKPWQDWDRTIIAQDALEFHIFCQYLCFMQWEEVKRTATAHGIFLKGDIPILINPDSSDVWHHRDLFLLDVEAGAPPDMYNADGQSWGFPLYNWQKISEQGYRWWIERLQLAEKLYTLFRLDHIVGFYRIWAIPSGKSGSEGFFIPKEEERWIPEGEHILKSLLEKCSMLPIGEDLGSVPPEVRRSLRALGIPGTKVLRWERNWQSDSSFIDPKAFDPLSMSTLSTHDSESLGQWWQMLDAEAKAYAEFLQVPYSEKLESQTRKRILQECHTSGSYFHINLLQEYLGMFDELSWSDPEDDRINIPGKVLDRNWTYRFKPSINEIIGHKGLTALMQELSKWQG